MAVNNDAQLVSIQREREVDALLSARERYKLLQEQTIEAEGASALTGYQKLIQGAHPGVCEVLEAWVSDALSAKGRTHTSILPIRTLGIEQTALLGLTMVIDTLDRCPQPREACVRIGEAMQQELWVTELFLQDSKTWGRLFPRIKAKSSSAPRRLAGAKRAAAGLDERTWQKWDGPKVMKVGEPILNAVLMGSGIVEIDNSDAEKRLKLTDQTRAWLDERDERLAFSKPPITPMVCPPRPWTANGGGPFVTKSFNKKSGLVRAWDNKRKKAIRASLKSGEMDRVLEAVNAINQTPWRINKTVHEAVKWVWDSKLEPTADSFSGLKKFPKSSLLEVPEEPPADLDEAAQRRLRGQRYSIINRNREAESEAIGFMKDMATADELVGYEQFWLPHNLDFRGRIYPMPHFNQQRTDHVKAMLEFAEAKPLGTKGAYWLAIHLANCGDFEKISKRPLRERYNWTLDNTQLIKDIANDYTQNLTWLEADKPFSFLAAIIEWAAYLREGPSYRSRCAVALDGSNSGLQHYSAALRAEEDAFYVNLRDEEEGQDIYRAVAERCSAHLRNLQGQGNVSDDERETIQQWLDHGVDRKVVKRSVMTFPYSSETFGFAEQIREDLMRPYFVEVREGRRDKHPFGDDGGYKASTLLAKIIWKSVNEIVERAGAGMDYFKKVSSVLAHEGKPVCWTTPLGLRVVHEYKEWDVKRVELRLFDRKIHTNAGSEAPEGLSGFSRVVYNMRVAQTERIKKSKQRSAVAPNVIHSMDASHMMLTILKAGEEGITNYSLIHDSFATHAADTERFFVIIREAFAQMYEEYDVFQVIDDYARSVLSPRGAKRLPPLPRKGNLDLNEVIRSQFAFS